ncbi:Protein UXT-like protein [Hordeum vulgare]|nr:Protein UXT-like protein [Hordeum vulgare]
MDDDLGLDAAAGLASLASSDKVKPHAPQKAATPKPKKVLTPEQRAKESAKRKDRRHAADVRDEVIAAAAVQQEVTNARVAAATRETLCMLGLNPSQHTFMKIQRRRPDMEAEKQARMLEMEAEKQAKMLEIEAANAKTKAKEVALASMMTAVEIMKVDLNTVSPRKRPWFEKMQADMLKFDDE